MLIDDETYHEHSQNTALGCSAEGRHKRARKFSAILTSVVMLNIIMMMKVVMVMAVTVMLMLMTMMATTTHGGDDQVA